MELPVIVKNQIKHFTSKHVMWISIVVFFTLFASFHFGLLRPNAFNYGLLIITSLLPIGTNIYGNTEYFPQNFDIISKLKIESTQFKLGEGVIYFDSISKIEIAVNDWLGKKIVENVRPYGSGPKLSRGINNSIKLIYKDNTEEEIYFQIQSENMFHELSYIVTNLYLTNIEIEERYDNGKSYGLRHLNYAEIQDFKRFVQTKNVIDPK